MCSRCADKISTFYVKHKEAKCPLYASYYCGLCAKYGHLQAGCPRQKAVLSKKLVASEEEADSDTEEEEVLEIKDDNQAIAAFLAARGLPVSKKAAENRETLEEYAEDEDLELVRVWQAKINLPAGFALPGAGSSPLPGAGSAALPVPPLARQSQSLAKKPAAAGKTTEPTKATIQIAASVTSNMTVQQFIQGLTDRGIELPKKYAVQVGARLLVSFKNLTSKDVIQIVSKV